MYSCIQCAFNTSVQVVYALLVLHSIVLRFVIQIDWGDSGEAAEINYDITCDDAAAEIDFGNEVRCTLLHSVYAQFVCSVGLASIISQTLSFR